MALKARMRLYEGKELDKFVNSTKNIPMHIIASHAKVLEIIMNGLSTIAEAEIDPVNAKMQLTTAELMEYLSADALDKDVALTGCVRAFNAIVVNEHNEPKNLKLRMHATNGTTLMHTVETLLDAWHIDSREWGGGDLDAEGNITLKKEDATVICTIAAAANEGNGSGFKIPTGWLCSMLGGTLECVGAIGAGQGTVFTMRVLDAIDLGTDVRVLTDHIWQVDSAHRSKELKPSIKIFQSGTEITFHEIYIAGAEDFQVSIYFLLWKK